MASVTGVMDEKRREGKIKKIGPAWGFSSDFFMAKEIIKISLSAGDEEKN
jgi:hypothetical protein